MMTQNGKFWLYNLVVPLIPGRFGKLRVQFLRWCGVMCDESLIVSDGARFYGNGRFTFAKDCIVRGSVRFESNLQEGGIALGAGSEVNHGSYLCANGGASIIIGDYCRIAHGVLIKTTSHAIDFAGKCVAGAETHQDIFLGAGSWLCAGAIVIPGVRIGKKNVIAAGACVTKSTEDGVLMAGVPAVVKKRYAI